MSDTPVEQNGAGEEETAAPQKRSIWLTLLPMAFVAALAGLFT